MSGENSQPKKALFGVALAALAVGGMIGYTFAFKQNGALVSEHVRQDTVNDKKLALYQDMRKLWADHVIWTREYIVGAIDNTADTNQAADRLMKNQEDIGAAIVPYYGKEAGDRLTILLKEHITIAVDLVAAAKVDDQTKFAEANTRWNQNASDIANFLSSANNHWPEEALTEAMNMHLKTTTGEAVARLKKDYAADVLAFDAVFEHIMVMSDTLAAGIIQQFPEKF